MTSRDAWIASFTMISTWYIADPISFEQVGTPFIIGFGLLVFFIWWLGRMLSREINDD